MDAGRAFPFLFALWIPAAVAVARMATRDRGRNRRGDRRGNAVKIGQSLCCHPEPQRRRGASQKQEDHTSIRTYCHALNAKRISETSVPQAASARFLSA